MLAGAATPLVRSKSSASGSTVQQPAFEQVAAMPSQQNGYDCGLYLCAAAQAMCRLMQQGAQQAAGNIAGVPQHSHQATGSIAGAVTGSTAGGTAENPAAAAADGTAAVAAGGTAGGTAAGTVEAIAGSTAEAGSGSKRKFEEHEQFGGGEDGKGVEERQQEQAGGGWDGKVFEEREREVLQSITSSSIDQLRQRMLELIEERAAKQQ
jgi:hypothetical protein